MPAVPLGAAAALAIVVLVAAVVDMREQRLPNALAVLIACSAAVLGFARGRLAAHALAAFTAAIVFALIEVFWRRTRGRAGWGMGDVKFVCALMLADPLWALAGCVLGLVALAIFGLASRQPALPALPFMAVALAMLALAGAV